MSDAAATVTAILLAQALAGGVVAKLLFRYSVEYNKAFLLTWARSWSSFALFYLTTALALGAVLTFPATHPMRTLLAIFSGTFSFLAYAWLLAGAWEISRKFRMSPSTAGWVLTLVGLTGALTPLLIAQSSGSDQGLARIAVRWLIGGIVFLFAAVEVARSGRQNVSFGLKLVAAAFALYGLNQLHYFGLTITSGINGQSFAYSRYLLFGDFVLQVLMGLGMLAALLEDERRAALAAGEEVEHLAYHDALTSLPNRLLFIDRVEVALAQAARYQQRLAIMVLDLDRFKEINDSLGHSRGDELLQQVTERLRTVTRQSDTVARFGGDEFALLVQKIDGFEQAAKVAQKILDAVKQPYFVDQRELVVTGSIGISIFPEDGIDPGTLIRNADTALFRAKEQNRDNYQLYEPGMNARALERLALENSLRKALDHEELVLFYQPLVDLRTLKVTAFEALIRWNHPDMGLLLPGRFIHAAEVSGAILPIGAWVVRTACKAAKEWQQKAPGIGVSVNLSARQFQQPELASVIRGAIQESGLDPHLLELEITETFAMQDAENSIRTLMELKQIGVRISMDDFGTGYSSLSYLKRFPIDIVKLDQSFVRDIVSGPDGGAIATAVIAMAHSLNLKVVAEGVETHGQLTFLRDRACDRFQGFFFSPPLSPVEFDTFLERRTHVAWKELLDNPTLQLELSH